MILIVEISQIQMETEIIKLNSVKNSLNSLFESLAAKFRPNKNYDVTVILQQNNDPAVQQVNSAKSQQQVSKQPDSFQRNIIFNENLQGSFISLACQNKSDHACLKQKSLAGSKKKNVIDQRSPGKRRTGHNKQNIASDTSDPISLKFAQMASDADNNILRTQIRINEEENQIFDNYEVKVNNQLQESVRSVTESSEADNDSNAGFLIESHLNQALTYVEENQFSELQDFLYNYKEKYNFINVRTQTKWSLLMAHCKQMKLQFQRAAANYTQVISNLKEYPRIIPVQLGDVYNRLGLCYFEIRQWNKGISAFSQALNSYKQAKKVIEYANCIINLGVLYYQVQYFIEAQKCFLMAYNIRRYQGEVKNRSNLLSVLFNLVECNMNLQNYAQSKTLLYLIEEIIDESENINVEYKINLYTKQGKLEFFEGNLSNTYKLCQQALNLINNCSETRLEYAQVYELMGLLKAQQAQFNRSKEYFLNALKIVQKYQPIDSIKVENIKKRLISINKLSDKSTKSIESVRRKEIQRNQQQFISSEESSFQIQESIKS